MGNTPPARWGAILTAADSVVSSGSFIGRPPILGAVSISRSRAGRYGPSPVMPFAATCSPILTSASASTFELITSCANTAAGCTPAVSLALLDVDGTTVQRNRFDLPELGTSNVVELLASSDLGLLWRKAVPMYRGL